MGKVVMYSSVSVDGFVADENDQPGPLFDWLLGGDVPLDESGGLKVSQTSYDYIRPYWDQIGVTLVGRHVFDLTDGWDGKPPGGMDHMVVVTEKLVKENPAAVKAVYELLLKGKQANPAKPGEPDTIPFGFEAVRPGVELAAEYAFQQRIIPRRFSFDEIFADAQKILG